MKYLLIPPACLLLAAAIWLERLIRRTKALQKTLMTLRASEENMRRQTRIQERLITVITHDIKSPLKYTALGAKALYEDLAGGRDITPAINNAKMIYESGYRIYHLTDNLLQYIRLQAQHDLVASDIVDLYALTEEKISIFRDIALAQSTVLINRITAPFPVKSNDRLLGIIVHNLLDNATKVTFEGTIEIDASIEAGNCYISIKDTGPGLPPEITEWCNRYSVVAESTPASHLNHDEQNFPLLTGLGLIMVKELTVLINGRLSAVSRPGSTVMTIHFKT